MSRTRLAVATVTILCALLVPSVASAAQTATPLTQKVAVTGTKGFKGTYTIERFVASGGKLYSVGTLKGKARGKRVTRENVRMPAAVTAAGAQSAQVPPIPGACQILNLSLAPINLNLLGLSVRTNQIDLRIEAVPGAGNLLGNLLCGVTNLLNPGQLANTPLGQLAQILNAILALSPRTS